MEQENEPKRKKNATVHYFFQYACLASSCIYVRVLFGCIEAFALENLSETTDYFKGDKIKRYNL